MDWTHRIFVSEDATHVERIEAGVVIGFNAEGELVERIAGVLSPTEHARLVTRLEALLTIIRNGRAAALH